MRFARTTWLCAVLCARLLTMVIVAIAAVACCAGMSAAQEELRVAIYVMKPNGASLHKVAQVPGYKEHSLPAWSRDGTRLAFDAMHESTRAKKVFVVNLDGSGLRSLCDGDSPDWSPDDKQIAYHAEGVLNTPQGIYVQNLDGKGRSRIVDAAGPRWSPDGALLATTDGRSLSLLDLISGEARNILAGPVEQVMPGFDWSPDGKRIAVVVRHAGAKELWIVDTEGAKPKWKSRLKVNLDPRVAWSPDGKQIAISVGRRLVMLEPDGKSTYRLPDQRGNSVEPAWSPDGQWLAFAGNHPEP